jgi:hypothetical protein
MFSAQIKEGKPSHLCAAKKEITLLFGSNIYQNEAPKVLSAIYKCLYWIFALNIDHYQEGSTC